jgi:hypothetical protein
MEVVQLMNLLEKKVMGDVYIFYLNKSPDLPFQNARKISLKKIISEINGFKYQKIKTKITKAVYIK